MCPQHNILAAPSLGQKPSFLWGPCVCRPRPKVKQWLLGFVSGESNPGRRTRPGLSCLEREGCVLDKAARHLVKVAPLDKRRENTVFPPAEWRELVRNAAQGQTKVDFVQTQKVLASALQHVFQDLVSRPHCHRAGKQQT